MQQLQEFIILSAELSKFTPFDNFNRTIKLKNMLNDLDLPFTFCEGNYNGIRERGFMVIVKDETELEVIRDLGLMTFEQESVLFRDFKGNAKLLYRDGTSQELGKFKQGESNEASTVVNGVSWVCT